MEVVIIGRLKRDEIRNYALKQFAKGLRLLAKVIEEEASGIELKEDEYSVEPEADDDLKAAVEEELAQMEEE